MIRDKYFSVEEGILNNNFEGMIRNKYMKKCPLINQEVLKKLSICLQAISIHLVQIIQKVFKIPNYKFEYKKQKGNLFNKINSVLDRKERSELLQKRLMTIVQ